MSRLVVPTVTEGDRSRLLGRVAAFVALIMLSVVIGIGIAESTWSRVAVGVALAPGLFAISLKAVLIARENRVRLSAKISIPVVLVFAALGIVKWEPAPFEVSIVIGLGVGLLTDWFVKQQLKIDGSMLLILLSLAVVSAITITRSPQPDASFAYWLITLLMMVVALAGLIIGQFRRGLDSLLVGYIYGAVGTTLVSFLGYFDLLPIRDLVSMGGLRLEGFFKDPNVYAPYLFLPALLLLQSLVSRSWLPGLGPLAVRVLSASMLVSAIFFAYSRAAWGGFFVSAGVLLLLAIGRNPRLLRNLIPLGIIAVVLGAIVWNALPEQQIQFFESRSQLQEYDSLRFQTQQLSWDRVSEYPLLGHGPITTRFNLGLGTHNLYLQMLYEHGFLGFFLLVLFIGGGVLFSIRTSVCGSPAWVKEWSSVLLASLVGQLATSLFIDSTHWRHFWLLLGLAWALPRLDRGNQREQSLSNSSG